MRLQVYLLSFLTLALTYGCQGGHQEKEQTGQKLEPANVQVMTAVIQDAPSQTEVVGTVQSVNRAVIAAKVTGTIEKMPVVLGSTVKAGDLMVKISAGEISAKVIQAQAQLEQARRNLAREKKLLKKNAATAESVKSLEDVFRVASAAHHEAETMLSYITITAPFDGQITSKNANVGDLATPGTPLLQLEDNQKLQVVISVPETQVLQLNPGDSLAIQVPAADLAISGTVAEIAPAADPLTRTAPVKIDIQQNMQLRAGQFARVALPGPGKDTLFVPSTAVQTFGQMDKIFVVRENTAFLRLVRTGKETNGQVEILSGLEPDETVVTSDIAQLVDGQPVTVTP
jgi:RND family efflux transporter MFP subunit